MNKLNNIQLLNEVTRIKEIMINNQLINESTVSSTLDDAIKKSISEIIKTELETAVKSITDDAIKKTKLDKINFDSSFLKKNYDRIALSVENKLNKSISDMDKSKILLATADELDQLKKIEVNKIINKNTGLIKQSFEGLTPAVQKTVKQFDPLSQKIFFFANKNVSKPKSWWKKIFERWGWVDPKTGKLSAKGNKRMAQILGGAVLLWWLSSDEKPMPKPKPDPAPLPKPGPYPNPKPRFKDCSDFPYKRGCKSSVIAEVQKCLGLSDDGIFGSKTEQALISGGYGSEITKEVYDKIKTKCSSTSVETTPVVDPNIADYKNQQYTEMGFEGL